MSPLFFLPPMWLFQGVGVALFSDAATASEACGRLSGVQADGRKLELVLMSPDNHISFSCKQVGGWADTSLFRLPSKHSPQSTVHISANSLPSQWLQLDV